MILQLQVNEDYYEKLEGVHEVECRYGNKAGPKVFFVNNPGMQDCVFIVCHGEENGDVLGRNGICTVKDIVRDVISDEKTKNLITDNIRGFVFVSCYGGKQVPETIEFQGRELFIRSLHNCCEEIKTKPGIIFQGGSDSPTFLFSVNIPSGEFNMF